MNGYIVGSMTVRSSDPITPLQVLKRLFQEFDVEDLAQLDLISHFEVLRLDKQTYRANREFCTQVNRLHEIGYVALLHCYDTPEHLTMLRLVGFDMPELLR